MYQIIICEMASVLQYKMKNSIKVAFTKFRME